MTRFSIARNGSLIIENAQLDDSAHYRCTVSNYRGKSSSSARVTVDTDQPHSKPVITTKPRNKMNMITNEEGDICWLIILNDRQSVGIKNNQSF